MFLKSDSENIGSERERAKTCHMCRNRENKSMLCVQKETDRQTDREHVVFFIQKEMMERGTSGLRVKPHDEAHELRGIICFNV